MTLPNSAWVFPEALQELLTGGDEEFVAEIVEVFKTQTQVRMRLLRDAADHGRLDEARAQAHAIKGGSSQVGANQLAEACSDIEAWTGLSRDEFLELVRRAELLFEEARRRIGIGE